MCFYCRDDKARSLRVCGDVVVRDACREPWPRFGAGTSIFRLAFPLTDLRKPGHQETRSHPTSLSPRYLHTLVSPAPTEPCLLGVNPFTAGLTSSLPFHPVTNLMLLFTMNQLIAFVGVSCRNTKARSRARNADCDLFHNKRR